MTDPRQRVEEIQQTPELHPQDIETVGDGINAVSELEQTIDELFTIATKALTRLDAAQAVIQRAWEHGCCCSDEEDYCKCDMVKAAKEWLEEAQDDG